MTSRGKTTIKLVGASTAIIASFGISIGLSIASITSRFVDLNGKHHYEGSYYDESVTQGTHWIGDSTFTDPFKAEARDSRDAPLNVQKKTSDKFNYAAEVINGASNQVMDKSFSQETYRGLANWVGTDTWYDPDKQNVNPPLHDPITNYSDYPKDGSVAANANKPTSDDSTTFYTTYDQLIGKGYRSIVLPGFQHINALDRFQKANPTDYKKAGYILLDTAYPDRNVASVVFRSDEAAFLTAITTCMYLNENFEHYYSDGKPLSVGMFGGIQIPSVMMYMGGLEYGLRAFNDYIDNNEMFTQIANYCGWTDMNKEHHKVQLINLGNSRSFFSDSFNAGDGRLLAQELLQRGADAIFPVVGPQAPDVAREIKSRGSSAIIVGVDVPQENDNTVNFKSVYTDKRKNDMTVKFSAVKNIANVTSKILSLSYAGDTGIEYDVGAYGYLTVGDASNNGMGVSSAALPYLYDFVNGVYHDSSDPSWVQLNVNIPNDYDRMMIVFNMFHAPSTSEYTRSFWDELSRKENMVFWL